MVFRAEVAPQTGAVEVSGQGALRAEGLEACVICGAAFLKDKGCICYAPTRQVPDTRPALGEMRPEETFKSSRDSQSCLLTNLPCCCQGLGLGRHSFPPDLHRLFHPLLAGSCLVLCSLLLRYLPERLPFGQKPLGNCILYPFQTLALIIGML